MKEALDYLDQFVTAELECRKASMDTEYIAAAEDADLAVKALKAYADNVADKPIAPDGFWLLNDTGFIHKRTLELYQGERPGKSLPPKHPAIILIPHDKSAVFVAIERPGGIQCVFRNDSGFLASDLIRQAMPIVWLQWPNRPLFTLVDPAKTKSRFPGFVFKMAGWRMIRPTRTGLMFGANPKWFTEAA